MSFVHILYIYTCDTQRALSSVARATDSYDFILKHCKVLINTMLMLVYFLLSSENKPDFVSFLSSYIFFLLGLLVFFSHSFSILLCLARDIFCHFELNVCVCVVCFTLFLSLSMCFVGVAVCRSRCCCIFFSFYSSFNFGSYSSCA